MTTHEHEIPKGGKLYFGATASLKRTIENNAVTVLHNAGFEEISTPYFTFQKYQVANAATDVSTMIRLSDSHNSSLTLRADSSLDVVRIITKRLGRSTNHKKWFYVQPVFRFPSTEINQIGAEILDSNDVAYAAQLSIEIFNKTNLLPTLQLSNVQIAKLAASEAKVDFDVFRKNDYLRLNALGIDWLDALLDMQTYDELFLAVENMPTSIRSELIKLGEAAREIGYAKTIIAPLYVPTSSYYTDIFFRMLCDNDVVARGGSYKGNQKTSCGFALYTDNIIKRLSL